MAPVLPERYPRVNREDHIVHHSAGLPHTRECLPGMIRNTWDSLCRRETYDMLPGQKVGKLLDTTNVDTKNRDKQIWKGRLPEGVAAVITKLLYGKQVADETQRCSAYAVAGAKKATT